MLSCHEPNLWASQLAGLVHQSPDSLCARFFLFLEVVTTIFQAVRSVACHLPDRRSKTTFQQMMHIIFATVLPLQSAKKRLCGPMSGETSLQHLLAHLNPLLDPTPLVFCSIKNGSYGDLAECHPIASIREPEGLTLVLPQSEQIQRGSIMMGCHSILLEVHSSLLAVGLTA